VSNTIIRVQPADRRARDYNRVITSLRPTLRTATDHVPTLILSLRMVYYNTLLLDTYTYYYSIEFDCSLSPLTKVQYRRMSRFSLQFAKRYYF